MKILVLNGSPKGDYSITLQTARYLEKYNHDALYTVRRDFYLFADTPFEL